MTEALELDRAPVVVVSAMGRSGAPYATDTLLGLVGELPSDDRERDLLASVGEVISAVVVAHELRGAGIEARAFTGAEAGIATDGAARRLGDSRDPHRPACRRDRCRHRAGRLRLPGHERDGRAHDARPRRQ